MRKKDSSPVFSLSILLIVPEGTNHQTAAQSFLTDQGERAQPIFFNPEQETVKIDLIRNLLQHTSYSRAATEPQALVVCGADTATTPAQNALLKVVEEPPVHTQIILVAYSRHRLLPTLLSRCREILWTKGSVENKPTQTAAKDLEKNVQQLQEFVTQPTLFSHTQLITLAEGLQKRAVAQQTLQKVISRTAKEEQKIAPKIMQNLLFALDSLEKNGNVRLVLEHSFFEIHHFASK